MKYLTVRNIPSDVAQALKREQRRRGASLNQTVLDLLTSSLGAAPGARRHNGLRGLAGTWTVAQDRRFQRALRGAEQIDEELWR